MKDINEALKQGLLGRIFLLEGNFVQAVPKLAQFYQTYPSSQNLISLSSAHLGNNDGAKAVKLLEEYLVTNPKNDRVKALLAELYINHHTDKAITTYAEIAKTQPKNVVINNNLAWLYLEEGKIEKALVHAKMAFDLAPEVANVVDTYGKVLLKKGDKRAALKHATKASSLTKGEDADIALNYAEALIANSRLNEAKVILEKTLTSTEEQKNKKEQLLATL